jgi:hypothetical protein
MSIFYRAAKIAEEAHASQGDKTGRPYIEHCRRVVDAVETMDQKVVANLHDVLEKAKADLEPSLKRPALDRRLLLRSTPCRAETARTIPRSCGGLDRTSWRCR